MEAEPPAFRRLLRPMQGHGQAASEGVLMAESRRPDWPAFEEKILAPRFLIGETLEDFTKRQDLVVYVYACRAEFCHGGAWAYYVRLVDMTRGVVPFYGPRIAGVAHSSKPLLNRESAAEEYERVSGFALDAEELEAAA